MRTLLITTAVCLTAGTFVAAERFTSSAEETFALEQDAATQAALEQQKQQSKEMFAAQIAALTNEKREAQTQVALLNTTVEEITSARDEVSAQFEAAQKASQSIRDTVAELEAANLELVARIEAKDATLVTKDAELQELTAQVAALAQEVASAPNVVEGSEDLSAEIASLTGLLEERDATIATLQERLDTAGSQVAGEAGGEGAAADPALVEELEVARATIDELTEAAAEQARQTQASIAAVNETLLERDTEIAKLQAELAVTQVAADAANPTGEAGSEPSENLAVLSQRLDELTALVDTQTKTISNLRMGFEEEPASPMEMASACIERANKIFEISQIKFATGTSSISDQSVTTLDHLRDLAIGCESEDLFIEIGGHTDSLGAEASNQTLSEARAQSVREFLIGRGIPAEKMIAVGYGESQPIASNDTQVGRAQNRRITFTWQMREEPADATETVENTDG